MNVLFHIDGVERWNTVITNAQHLLSGCAGGPVQIEIVACGEAVRTLIGAEAEKRSGLTEGLRDLAIQGVEFAVCGKALERYCIPAAYLLDVARVVPLGAAELAEKQAAGWAYIKF